MNPNKDYLSLILGLVGLFSAVLAIRLTLKETSGTFFYIFLTILLAISLYLLYTVITTVLEEWTNYRWSPDRLR